MYQSTGKEIDGERRGGGHERGERLAFADGQCSDVVARAAGRDSRVFFQSGRTYVPHDIVSM